MFIFAIRNYNFTNYLSTLLFVLAIIQSLAGYQKYPARYWILDNNYCPVHPCYIHTCMWVKLGQNILCIYIWPEDVNYKKKIVSSSFFYQAKLHEEMVSAWVAELKAHNYHSVKYIPSSDNIKEWHARNLAMWVVCYTFVQNNNFSFLKYKLCFCHLEYYLIGLQIVIKTFISWTKIMFLVFFSESSVYNMTVVHTSVLMVMSTLMIQRCCLFF